MYNFPFVKTKKPFVKPKILSVKCDSAFVDHQSHTRISFRNDVFLRQSCRDPHRIHKLTAADSQRAALLTRRGSVGE